jgi:hypothetical protein
MTNKQKKKNCIDCFYVKELKNRRSDEPQNYGCTYTNYEGYVSPNDTCPFFREQDQPTPQPEANSLRDEIGKAICLNCDSKLCDGGMHLEKCHILKATAQIMESVRKNIQPTLDFVIKQAMDEKLWFIAQTTPESYLQEALRKLHQSIEMNCKAFGKE